MTVLSDGFGDATKPPRDLPYEHETIAVFSRDGKAWSDNSRHALRHRKPVSKIVIGRLDPQDESELVSLEGEVLSFLEALAADRDGREKIKQLHLWSVDTTQLPESLLAGLTELNILDLRECSKLERLDALPTSLEVLDLGGCAGLQELSADELPRLAQLHFDRCSKLTSETMNKLLAACGKWSGGEGKSTGRSPKVVLQELTCADCVNLDSLDALSELASRCDDENPVALRKLVLSGCTKLGALPDLTRFENLAHLNLNGCRGLRALPELPIGRPAIETIAEVPLPGGEQGEDNRGGLQYLVTHDCRQLRSHRDLDLSNVLNSGAPDDNIVDTARAFSWIGGNVAELRCAKLILLGSGRVGKTTLAKALNWSTLTAEERDRHRGNGDLDPVPGSPSTHGVKFWQLDANGQFELADVGEIDPDTRASIHLWDFGGQEIYHRTHRIFAEAGTVFVIVTTDPGEHATRTGGERPADELLAAIYDKENTYRDLRYWLDFVRSAVGADGVAIQDLPVLIVHAGARASERGTGGSRLAPDLAYLDEQAGWLYQPLMHRAPRHWLNCHDHQFEDPDTPAGAEFRRLCFALSGKLRDASRQMGRRVPAFFRDVNSLVAQRLLDFNQMRHAVRAFSFDEWADEVRGELDIECSDPRVHPAVMRAVTRYLHRAGRLLWLGEHRSGKVLLDQRLAIDIAYELLSPFGRSFAVDELGRCREEDLLAHLRDRLQRESLGAETIVAVLERCDLCVASGQTIQFLPSEQLPDFGQVQERLRVQWEDLRRTSSGFVNRSCRLAGEGGAILGQADYQSVAAWFGRAFLSGQLQALLAGTDRHAGQLFWGRQHGAHDFEGVFFWQRGLQGRVSVQRRSSDGTQLDRSAIVRIEWRTHVGKRYEVSLYFQVLSDDDSFADRLLDAVLAGGGPLASFQHRYLTDDLGPTAGVEAGGLRGEGGLPWDHLADGFVDLRRMEVAISYRAEDKEVARAVENALNEGQISCFRYHSADSTNPVGPGHRHDTIELLRWLRDADCLVVVCSEDYFDLDKEDPERPNVYCPIEFAAGVQRFAESKHRYVPIPFLVKSEGLTRATFDRAAKQYFENLDEHLRGSEQLSDLLAEGLTPAAVARNHIAAYLTAGGENGSWMVVYDPREGRLDAAVKEVVAAVRRQLGK